MDEEKKKRQELNFEKFIELIQSDRATWQFINKKYCCSGRQARQLREILEGIKKLREAGVKKRQDNIQALRGQIYLYGSMIKSRDLIARQVFLWLLELLEQL